VSSALATAQGRGRGSSGLPFQNAAPPCFDNVNRYVDCGNGTVTDTLTGLVWLRDAGCLSPANYAAANDAAASLEDGLCGLSDGSRAGDWRLPTESEWAATVLRAQQLGCTGASSPSLTTNGGNACLAGTLEGSGSGQHAFVNVPAATLCTALNDTSCTFWSSTTESAFGTLAGRARLFFGSANDFVLKTTAYGVWPVRR
jgi:hypothetical protein